MDCFERMSLRLLALTATGLLLCVLTACTTAAEPTLAPQATSAPEAAPTQASPVQEVTEETLWPTPAPEATKPPEVANPTSQPTESPEVVLPTMLPSLVAPVLSEQRRISLDWPQAVRVGDSDTLWLKIEVDENGRITPTVRAEGHVVTGQTVEIPDLYATHTIKAVARLDISGMIVKPEGEEFRQMLPHKTVEFAWSVSPQQEGLFRGTVWVYMDLTPKTGGQTERQTLMAVPLEIEGRSVIGLPANVARWGGLAGTGLSIILGFPFLEQILSWLLRRFSKVRTNK